MKFFILYLVAFIFLILDTSFMPFVNINGHYTSLLSLYFFIYCLNNEKYDITYFSLYVGFLQDVFFYNSFGINIFINLVIGIILNCLSVKYNKNKNSLSIFFITVASLLKSFLMVVYLFVFFKVNVDVFMLTYEFIYTFILLLFMYPIFNSMFKSKLFKKTMEF